MGELEKNLDIMEGQQEGTQGHQSEGTDGKEPEKTLTQAEVDEIVKERLARERKKYADYEDIKEQYETLKEISDLLAQGGVAGTPAEQIAHLRQYYGLTQKQAEQMVNAATDKGADETKALSKRKDLAAKQQTMKLLTRLRGYSRYPSANVKKRTLLSLRFWKGVTGR